MKKVYHQVKQCRACGNKDLIPILSLGDQFLTGVFPKTREQDVPSGPLDLIKCDDRGNDSCGLLQLQHSYDPVLMYGQGYGYRSSLNNSMVSHLEELAAKTLSWVSTRPGDLILDIGSNDGTLLKSYPVQDFKLVGIDPSAEAFKQFYPSSIDIIEDFFSANLFKKAYGLKKAKIVTSVAMFYDLEKPVDFMRQVGEILDEEGVWVLEQSYMPSMVEHIAYDTICHEHAAYYGFKQIIWMAKLAGLKAVDVELNDINGGSFSVVLAQEQSRLKERDTVGKLLKKEKDSLGLSQGIYENFEQRVMWHKEELRQAVGKIKDEGKKILGYGASTKGNVILQYCGFTPQDIPFIAEVNQDKFGSFTPGTHIPIIPEQEAHAMDPDYMMVLPWHFKQNIIARERNYLGSGGKLFFPLPQLEIVAR